MLGTQGQSGCQNLAGGNVWGCEAVSWFVVQPVNEMGWLLCIYG